MTIPNITILKIGFIFTWKNRRWRMRPLYGLIIGICLAAAFSMTTGCQSHIGGQTLPSGYYLSDDVQYFSPGPRNNLQNEAAKLQAQE